MRCQWQELMAVLPAWLSAAVKPLEKEALQELRLRLGSPPELVVGGRSRWLERAVAQEDIHTCINSASRYSPWAAATVSRGYITAPGGHRVGLCGEAVMKDGHMAGIRRVTSLHIRVARDIPGIASGIRCRENMLIIGAPGWGKTTLLRDLIRQISNGGSHISVVDERCELFPGSAFDPGRCTDILSGCGKREGIDAVLRAMGPDWIALDEITEEGDCEALIRSCWCGVRLIATAHAASIRDLRSREVYRSILQSKIFPIIVVLKPDKTWTQERMDL